MEYVQYASLPRRFPPFLPTSLPPTTITLEHFKCIKKTVGGELISGKGRGDPPTDFVALYVDEGEDGRKLCGGKAVLVCTMNPVIRYTATNSESRQRKCVFPPPPTTCSAGAARPPTATDGCTVELAPSHSSYYPIDASLVKSTVRSINLCDPKQKPFFYLFAKLSVLIYLLL